MKVKTLALLLPPFASLAFAAPLQLDVYNSQNKAIFPVSPTLVSGPKEAISFDAQFNTKGGEQLVRMIRASSKALKAIVIASGNPDFYFSLEPIVKAFPRVKVLATPQVIDHIRATKETKLQFWGPQMKDDAPTSPTVPRAITQAQFTAGGKTLELRRANDYVTHVWIPANRAIIGGTNVAPGIHIWMMNTQSEQQRSTWRSVLSEMQNLQPARVVPGHHTGDRPTGSKIIRSTQDYSQSSEQALGTEEGSGYVIKTTTTAWLGLADISSLELSARVNSGKIKW